MLVHQHAQEVSPSRVVVMGAHGFVGSAITRALRLRNIPVLPLSKQDVDLLSADARERLSAQLRPTDSFVAVSAIAPVKTPPMLRENIRMIEVLAEALKASPVAHILNIGSDAIYADSSEPLHEASCTGATSLHGVMHLTRHLLLKEAAAQTPFAALRPTLIYGSDDPHNGYGPNRFRRLAAEGKEIVLFGEGEERRDQVLIDDVAELAVRILLRRSSGILNAATGTVVSFRECAEQIGALFPTPPSILPSPRVGPMPHDGYRAFSPKATSTAFADFHYVQPSEGFARVHAACFGAS